MVKFFEDFYWIYILLSLKDGKKYTGYTKNLPSRFEAHQKGEVKSTKDRRPFKLIYFEGCLNQQDATKREKHLSYGIKSKILMHSIIPQDERHIPQILFHGMFHTN